MKKHQYFKVDVEKVTAAPFFNLYVTRLVKKKEALESGFAPVDQYLRAAEIRGISERDAQCIVMALENPRPPLRKGEEKRHWAFKLKKLVKSVAGKMNPVKIPSAKKVAKIFSKRMGK